MHKSDEQAGAPDKSTAEKPSNSKPRKSKRKSKSSKKSSGWRPYPRVALEKVIAIPKAIKEKNGGNPWPAAEIAAVLGVSAKGVNFIYYLLSSKKFGSTDGTSADGWQVMLTALAWGACV